MFQYENETFFVEKVLIKSLTSRFGTPLYVYSAASIRQRCQSFKTIFSKLKPHIHYSVKANSNLAILRLLHAEGTGFDVVSGGELARLQAANISFDEVGFAGVGKTRSEIQKALGAGVGFFSVESLPELERIARYATEFQMRTRVLLRLNPNVDPKTHRYITTGQAINKFGLDFDTANSICDSFTDHNWVQIVGFHIHLGSQIQEISPYIIATRKVLDLIEARRSTGQKIEWLNLGGGFGIADEEDIGLSLEQLGEALVSLLRDKGLNIILEPGRWLVGGAGVLLTEVQYVKKAGEKTFVIVDAGMHTMIRPALYGSRHRIWPVNQPEQADDLICCDVVGPICESTDFLAQDRLLPPVKEGDILALFDAGAYGFVMTSTYNSHPRPAEVLVDGDVYRLIRRREMYSDLMAWE